ncbi:polysaccharide deacetylase family protein [Oceanobacillus sp. M60]|uniref:polysaccharide deacetylase family protein n=1 Tax=Oceanobacillus oncorhynchi TaxID=545501 RepID=UPI0021169131|nr:polysaccharide deacetylase family protein [Oceanobacillus oncorhynchi]UUI40758.1 polysaccharide deacetylase family protein [Oceanobacillus oncorhynchi]
MPSQSNKNKLNVRRKNTFKLIKSLFQFVVISLLAVLLIRTLFITERYETLSSDTMVNEEGFLAISYFGVDRSGSTQHVSKEQLEKQLTVLKEQGFETISQQQILEYYHEGKLLPEKALYLSFEDGRTDSSIFSQSLLEELNYKATMYTYANKFEERDTKFLKPNDLKTMMRSGYWELGTNGYQLSYINTFNENGESLGELDNIPIPDHPDIEYYNHYLMDYLRDEYMIPKETRREMEERILNQYNKMHESYTEHFNEIPNAYAIMHANSMYNNMDQSVESINEKMITDNFSLHFNRDLTSFNGPKTDIYNLNRLQVAPWWSTNHLLMKIQEDYDWGIQFENGDESIANLWSINGGVGEFVGEKIILTSQPEKEVVATLKEVLPESYRISMNLEGNVMGEQTFYLSNDNKELKFSLEQNKLYIYQRKSDKEEVLFETDLSGIKWNQDDYAFNKAMVYTYEDTQQGSRVDDDEYPVTLQNNRQIVLDVNEQEITVEIDGKNMMQIDWINEEGLTQFAVGGKIVDLNTQHQQNTDTIYDSVVNMLQITSEDDIIYQVIPPVEKKLKRDIKYKTDEIIDFFIEYL